MLLPKAFLLATVLAVVNSRSINDVRRPTMYIEDSSDIIQDDREDILSEQSFESVYPTYNQRIKRQAHGAINTNPDGSINVFAKLPLVGNSNNMLSATGSINGAKPGGSFDAVGAGLSLDNVNGHGLSLSGKHIPSFGDQLTAAGKLNLLNTDQHNLNANAFTTRNMPSNPNLPNFSTHGGSLDYMYNNKVGASVGLSHTPLMQKTDLSLMGNLNLFRDRASSLDLNAGATRSYSPFIPKRSWEPSVGLTYSRYF